MQQVKPWQVVVIVVAVVAVSVSAYLSFTGNRGPDLVDQLMLVDITTGDLYTASLSGHKGVVTPAKNPETGKVALFITSKNSAGVWTISRRDLTALSMIEGEPKALVDRKTGEVRVTAETPKKFN